MAVKIPFAPIPLPDTSFLGDLLVLIFHQQIKQECSSVSGFHPPIAFRFLSCLQFRLIHRHSRALREDQVLFGGHTHHLSR